MGFRGLDILHKTAEETKKELEAVRAAGITRLYLGHNFLNKRPKDTLYALAKDLQETGITELDLPENNLWTMDIEVLKQFFTLLTKIQTLTVLRLHYNGAFKNEPSQASLNALFSIFGTQTMLIFDDSQHALCSTLLNNGQRCIIGDDSGNYEDPFPTATK